MLLLPAGALCEGGKVFAPAANLRPALKPKTVHRIMLLLCGSASAAVRLAMCLPLLVRGGALLCSTWWWLGQWGGVVACRRSPILLF